MCGRTSAAVNYEVLQEWFKRMNVRGGAPWYTPRYNIAPTQDQIVVDTDEGRVAKTMRWGLIPSWAKDEKIGNSLINARAETVATSQRFARRSSIAADS